MTEVGLGDLVTIPPHASLYPAAYSSPAALTTDQHLTALVVSIHGFYLNIILPSGKTAWIHKGSCRLARKADRT